MIRLRRRPLLHISDPDRFDGFDAMEPDAIVLYRRIVIEHRTVVLSDEACRAKGYAVEEHPTKWKTTVIIDLWIVRIRLQWISSV